MASSEPESRQTPAGIGMMSPLKTQKSERDFFSAEIRTHSDFSSNKIKQSTVKWNDYPADEWMRTIAALEGMGALHVLESFRRAGWHDASGFVYLFVANDLRNDVRSLDFNTVLEGHVVTKYNRDGTPHTVESYRARIRRREKPHIGRVPSWFRDGLRLRHVRERISMLLDTDRMLLGSHLEWYQVENVKLAVEYTRQMQTLARQRGISFYVLIIPTLPETRERRYNSFTRAYVDALRAEKIGVIEILNEASIDDYFAHDGHFSPQGAARAAQAILAAYEPGSDGISMP